MDTHRWLQIKALFQEALHYDPDERAAFLDKACHGDAKLLKDVLKLLHADEVATRDFMQHPPAMQENLLPNADGTLATGARIGTYRIVRKIGEGGMGFVYLAERADGQFEQQVAIKLVRRNLNVTRLQLRFSTERRILARLAHPNIARLFDGGLTEPSPGVPGGIPYLIMEYIDGWPIDTYCDTHHLDTNARLNLFRTVCEAVHYAHQNLVVHRDLKPSNILVTKGDGTSPEGTVKLLDFGIAKLVDEDNLDPEQRLTRTEQRLMTPAYASPEQVRGTPVTTATDVYALGVILYELLTGQRPYRFQTASPVDIQRIICEVEPERPSTVVTRAVRDADTTSPAELRATEPDRLRKRLSGDLDNIVMMALRKEADRRYASAEQLAEDLRRHLVGLPVSARKDTLGYLISRFIYRHKIGVAATTLLFLAVLGGTIGIWWQAGVAERERERAERRFTDVRQLANALLFDVHDAVADLPGSTPVRELLVSRSLEYLDRLTQEGIPEEGLRIELAEAYRKVGDVQGNPFNANLGQTEAAFVSYQKAESLLQPLTQEAPNEEALYAMARVYDSMGSVQSALDELDTAAQHMRDAIALYVRLANANPEDIPTQVRYAVGLINLADLTGNPKFPNLGDREGAKAYFMQARDLLQSLYDRHGDVEGIYRRLAVIYERIGDISEDPAEVQAAFEQSLAMRQTHAERNPNSMDAVRDLAIAHEKMGDLALQNNNLDAALDRYETAGAIYEDLYQADTLNAQARQTLVIGLLHIADVHGRPDQPNLGNPTEAHRLYRRAERLLADLAQRDPTNSRTQFLLDLFRERLDGLAAN